MHQSIIEGVVWNIMQRLGERIREEEEHAVKQMNADQLECRKSKYLPCMRHGMQTVSRKAFKRAFYQRTFSFAGFIWRPQKTEEAVERKH